MAETEQIIRLQGNEDIHALRTIVARAQTDRVLLVVPRRHPALNRLVRLKLLVRQAHDHGKQLALVTRDPDIRELAREINLSVFRSVSDGQRARRWAGASGILSGNGDLKTAAVGATSQQPHPLPRPLTWRTGRAGVLERRRELGKGGDWGERIALTGLGIGLLVVLVAVLVLVVPSAQITLVPRQDQLSVLVSFVADPDVEVANLGAATVPAQVISAVLEATAQTPTSGRKDVPDARATGTVLFVNLTDQAVPVPAGTIVSTSSAIPVKFRTLQPVTVPPGADQRAIAPIEAVRPGLEGNVAAQQINEIEGPAGVVLRVLNPDPIQGGTVKQAAIVTAADKEQLREQLRQRLNQEVLHELQTRTPSDSYFVQESIAVETITESFDRQVDEQADVLSLLVRVRATALAVARSDVERMARRSLLDRVPEGFVLLDEGMRVDIQQSESAEEGAIRVVAMANGVVAAELNGNLVRTLIRGQPLDEAGSILLDRLPLAADPVIEVSPSWWPRVPYLPLRIFVRVAALPGSSE